MSRVTVDICSTETQAIGMKSAKLKPSGSFDEAVIYQGNDMNVVNQLGGDLTCSCVMPRGDYWVLVSHQK